MPVQWIGHPMDLRECKNTQYELLELGLIHDRDNLNDIFQTNVTSVHMVTQAFLPLLRKGNKKSIVNM